MRKPATIAIVVVILAGAAWGARIFATNGRVSAPPPSPPPRTVEVVRPLRADLTRWLDLPGGIEPFEQADLYTKVTGYVKEIRADIGDRVKAGQVLAVIDLPETEKEL